MASEAGLFPLPRLVGVLSDPAALAPRLDALLAGRLVDWVELRFDQLPEARWPEALALAARLRAGGVGVLGTLRLASDGGAIGADDEARVESVRRLLPSLDALDVELRSAHRAALLEAARAASVKTVASIHFFDGTPPLETLEALHAEARALAPDFVKLACRVHTRGDFDTLAALQAAHRDGDTAVLGMGPDAVALRLHLPTVGGALAYGYLDVSTAPGQCAAEALRAHFELAIPGYDARREASIAA